MERSQTNSRKQLEHFESRKTPGLLDPRKTILNCKESKKFERQPDKKPFSTKQKNFGTRREDQGLLCMWGMHGLPLDVTVETGDQPYQPQIF
ncbi:hypothetical protein GDO81_020902 [Engystomops pustulosus]|uniref:Uncharacterized protein n=1 Tax=Engystomops pustulosus TaxID=76066 RepID=A0AAV6YR79_ENGPU|nr:hypothetical protein GDO81_020902 [Engystomops pustulosus]